MLQQVFLVIPVFNRINYTLECLASVYSQTFKRFKVIVVDDGSSDGTSERIKDIYPEVIIVTGDGSLWWTGATNLGVKKALELSNSSDDYILTLNNDLIVPANYLEALIALAERFPKALIGSVSVDIANPEKIYYAGTIWNSKTAKYKSAVNNNISYTECKSATDYIATDLLPGRGVLISCSVFKQIGLYDFVHFPQYMADEDFSLRAKKAGFQLLVSTKSSVLNYVNETGLKKRAKDFKFYKDFFTSIKSPVNLRNRWNWAKKHSTIHPLFYFLLDISRIIKSLALNIE